MAKWGFLTNYALVLMHMASHQNSTLREISIAVGITERATISILQKFGEEGIVSRWKEGRRNRYRINPRAVMRHLKDQTQSPYTIEQIASQTAELVRQLQYLEVESSPETDA